MNIVITGGSKGMGKAMAEKFASANHNLFICSRTRKDLIETADDLKARYNASVEYYAADLSKKEEVLQFAQCLLQKKTDIDVLINNAGLFVPGSVYNEPEGNLEQMLEVNLYSAYHLTRALIPKMIKRKSGHIFNMCSIAALQAYKNGGAYSISKFALLGFSRNLREEMKPYSIKVTAILPGAAFTDSWAKSGVSPDRIMEASDVAEIIYASSQLSPQACVEEIILRPQLGDL